MTYVLPAFRPHRDGDPILSAAARMFALYVAGLSDDQ